eukprot:TRINITY_DN2426_c0_g1_i1.p2 TRINITY_DN2426_c0_g1~~TRINITY_DN2426_c0_g1_i1.p2  ORF type:complete len:328 (-),score=103.47 TRINITY_DN2426_c0_g1_i1:131-1114(-)
MMSKLALVPTMLVGASAFVSPSTQNLRSTSSASQMAAAGVQAAASSKAAPATARSVLPVVGCSAVAGATLAAASRRQQRKQRKVVCNATETATANPRVERLRSMKKELQIAPSILSADFSRLGDDVADALNAGADWVHFDAMDGRFVPNITIGPLVLDALRKKHPDAVMDVHLMIVEPEERVQDFAKAGADIISVHVEANSTIHLHRVIQQIKSLGCMAGLVLNPGTPLSAIEYVLEEADLVMLMSVNPGFGGQSFIESTCRKMRELKQMCKEKGVDPWIEVDGGVSGKNAYKVIDAGCNAIVAGSAVFCAPDYKEAIDAIRNSKAP